jgi:hypothetical protein
MSPRSLRVVTFQALGPDSSVDAVLRDRVLPRLLDARAVVDAWQGRRGSTDGNHVLVSTWDDAPPRDGREPADVVLLRDPDLAALGGVEIKSVADLEVAVHARFERPEPARVLRVFHGTVRPGELPDYVEEARAGMSEDARINDGLVSFVLGHDGVESFASVSTWTGWPAIEAATGGNTRQPFATRQPRRLTGFRIVHLELLPEAPVQRARRLDAELEPAT